jgi:hypothetical protein
MSKISLVWSKILRDELYFMSIGVFSICGKILLAYVFILTAYLNIFGIFGDDIVFIKSI